MASVYLNGEFIPETQAKISIFDRGFLFADSVYEVIPVYRNKFVCLNEHLLRLEQSLKSIHMTAPIKAEKWQEIFSKLIALNKYPDENLSIYLQVTRGSAIGRSHEIPSNTKPTVLAMCYPTSKKPNSVIEQGLSAITEEDKRRQECHIKSTSLLPNVLAFQSAIDCGAHETILIRDGFAVEGTSSNLFVVNNDTLITPPLQPQILAGVTRHVILEMARLHQINIREASITEEALFESDEVWLTGSTKEIYPIVNINNHKIGTGKPGPLWKKMMALYQQFKSTGLLQTSANSGDSAVL